MAKNSGKQFENDFSSSVPSYCYTHRLRDSAQSYNNSKGTTFSWDNECDFFVWDGKHRLFCAFECKSTKYKSMSVQQDKNDKSQKMIKLHQIESLRKISNYDYTLVGFFFNFRHFEDDDDKEKYIENTYFQSIKDFDDMMRKINKKSFNEIDLLTVGNAVKISGQKKRVHFKWDIDSFLESQMLQFID